MVRPACVSLFLALAACTPGAAPVPAAPAPAADPYTACAEAADADACAARVEQGLIAASGGQVRREGGTLAFRTASGRSIVLEDDRTEGDRYVRHFYQGFLPEIGQHLVRVGFYEGGAWLLVGAAEADQTILVGAPVVSPDRSRFAATSVDLVAGYDRNAIQVWRIVSGRPRLEWGVDGGDVWGASDAVWIDARTVEFTRHVNPDGDPYHTEKIRTRLVLGDGGFTLRPLAR